MSTKEGQQVWRSLASGGGAYVGNEDRHLVFRSLAGDFSAFEDLYTRHGGRVVGYFLRLGFATHDAEDLCQEVLLRAFKSLRTFDTRRGTFSTWLRAISRNVARRRWGRRTDVESFDPILAEEMFVAGDRERQSPEAREENAAVRDCVELLPAELGRIVRLRYIDGRTTRGIAKVTGIPEATVRSRLAESQARLARCLGAKGVLK